MKMEANSSSSSLSQSSSSNQAKDSSQESKIPPTQQLFLSATANTTVSGAPESPPLGSGLSLAPLGSGISLDTANATVSGAPESLPLGSGLSLAPLGSGLSLDTANATVSGAPESLPRGSGLSLAPLGSGFSLATANATVSGAPESLPLGSGLLSAQPKTTVSATSPPLKSQKTEAGSSASSSARQVLPFVPLLPLAPPRPLGYDLSSGMPNANVSHTSTSQKKDPKPKALNFPIIMITIGDWTKTSVQRHDIIAKCYFGKEQLVWEFVDEEQTETGMKKVSKKIEIAWTSVLSHGACLQAGIMNFELSTRPKFYRESDPLAGIAIKWIEIPELAPNHPSSICRRHRIHVDASVAKKNHEKLLQGCSKLADVPFPSLDSLFF